MPTTEEDLWVCSGHTPLRAFEPTCLVRICKEVAVTFYQTEMDWAKISKKIFLRYTNEVQSGKQSRSEISLLDKEHMLCHNNVLTTMSVIVYASGASFSPTLWWTTLPVRRTPTSWNTHLLSAFTRSSFPDLPNLQRKSMTQLKRTTGCGAIVVLICWDGWHRKVAPNCCSQQT